MVDHFDDPSPFDVAGPGGLVEFAEVSASGVGLDDGRCSECHNLTAATAAARHVSHDPGAWYADVVATGFWCHHRLAVYGEAQLYWDEAPATVT